VTPSLPTRLLNSYLARLYRVAASDAVIATAFIRVLNLVDAPSRLLAPAIVRRVFKRLPRGESAAHQADKSFVIR